MGAEVLIVGDLQALVEGLAREASVGVVGVGVGVARVGEQAEEVVEVRAASRVLLGVGGEALGSCPRFLVTGCDYAAIGSVTARRAL